KDGTAGAVGRSRFFRQPGVPVLPRGRHHRNSAQATNVGCQVGRALRQAGLCLFAPGRCLSLSGWRATAIPLYERGRWKADKALLDYGLSKLFAQIPVHDRTRAADSTMGA